MLNVKYKLSDVVKLIFILSKLSLQHYINEANLIWTKMKDFQEKRIGMSHDGYLKLYQLSRPSLRSYDCILIDEAQDLTPGGSDNFHACL